MIKDSKESAQELPPSSSDIVQYSALASLPSKPTSNPIGMEKIRFNSSARGTAVNFERRN